jgi:hypothetical protein
LFKLTNDISHSLSLFFSFTWDILWSPLHLSTRRESSEIETKNTNLIIFKWQNITYSLASATSALNGIFDFSCFRLAALSHSFIELSTMIDFNEVIHSFDCNFNKSTKRQFVKEIRCSNPKQQLTCNIVSIASRWSVSMKFYSNIQVAMLQKQEPYGILIKTTQAKTRWIIWNDERVINLIANVLIIEKMGKNHLNYLAVEMKKSNFIPRELLIGKWIFCCVDDTNEIINFSI